MGKLKGASAPYDIGVDSSVDKKYFKAKNEVGFKQKTGLHATSLGLSARLKIQLVVVPIQWLRAMQSQQ